MADPDFPDGGALVVGYEMAFGADISGDQDLWPWTNLSVPGDSIFMNQEVSIARGRQNESSNVAPTAADVDVDNPDGDLTPGFAASPYYPNVDLGTPARFWVEAPTPRLYLRPVDGSRAFVNTVAALNITTDLDVRIDMHLKSMSADGAAAAIAGRASSSSLFSWRVKVHADRTVTLEWSTTGSTPALSITSTTPVVPMSARSTLRVTLDVNNGAAGRTATFYAGPGVTGPFTQVGPTVVQAGTTSIFNAAAPLVVGDASDLPANTASDANVYAFQVLNGIAGSPVADVDFTAQTPGDDTFVDAAGRTWHVNEPAAEVSNRWYRIVGTSDEIAPTWPWGDLSSQQDGGLGAGEARVTIANAGILRRLGQGARLLDSALRRAVANSFGVLSYWPMEDEDGATSIVNAINGGAPMTFSGDLDLAAESTLAGSKPLPKFTATSSISGALSGNFGGRWQFDWYINAAAGPASPTVILSVAATAAATAVVWLVQISAGAVTVTGYSPTNVVITTATSAPTDMFGGWTHLQLVIAQQGANVEMTFNWTPVRYPAGTTSTMTSSFAGVVGNPTGVSVPASALMAGIAYGHLSASSLSVIVNIGGNAATGWEGDAAAARIARLCSEEGVRFRVIGEPSTTTQMGPQQVATLLTLLNEAEDVDGGILYEMPDAVGLLYRTRESMYNQPPNLILDALQNQVANPFLPVLDDQNTRNDITVTRRGGSSFRAIDQPSIDKRGDYPDTPTLNLLDDTQLQDAAGWLLHQGVVPGMRYPSLATNLAVAPELIDDWLTVDQGARVHAINLPPQHPAGTVKVIAEGYGESVSPFTWEPAMNCSPASVWDVTVVDGDGVADAYLLRLETDGSQTADALDATDTTFRVIVTVGPLWVTSAGEFPFDINVGGEQMTVSDIDAVIGGEEFTAAGNQGVANTVSHVAPSVVAVASGDLLICAWQSFASPGAYTLPGGMAIGTATSGTFTTFEDATQTLGASGATGTRTATFAPSDRFSAVSIAVHSASGSPTVVEVVSGYSATLLTLTTSAAPVPGDWLLVINGWDWDPGNSMDGPVSSGWTLVADSGVAGTTTSRIQAWAKLVTVAGAQSATLPIGSGVTDNQGRLYVLRGPTGPTQLFTVARSVNGVVKSHAIAAPVTLWNQPVLAR